MTLSEMPDDSQLTLAALDEIVDHVRGSPAGHLIIEYGDYECPYSRQAFHAIEQVERQLGGNVRFAFRHFPLTGIHPHARAAATAAEAAAHRAGSRTCTSCCSTGRTDPPGCQQRPALRPAGGHADSVHRRPRPPRRLRPAHPDGCTGTMKVIRSRGAP